MLFSGYRPQLDTPFRVWIDRWFVGYYRTFEQAQEGLHTAMVQPVWGEGVQRGGPHRNIIADDSLAQVYATHWTREDLSGVPEEDGVDGPIQAVDRVVPEALVIQSPDGQHWALSAGDDGQLCATAVPANIPLSPTRPRGLSIDDRGQLMMAIESAGTNTRHGVLPFTSIGLAGTNAYVTARWQALQGLAPAHFEQSGLLRAAEGPMVGKPAPEYVRPGEEE